MEGSNDVLDGAHSFICKPWWLGLAQLSVIYLLGFLQETFRRKKIKRFLNFLLYLYFAIELVTIALEWEASDLLTAVLVRKSCVSSLMVMKLLTAREWKSLKKRYGPRSYAYGVLYLLYSTVGLLSLVLLGFGALHAIWLPVLVGSLCVVFLGRECSGNAFMGGLFFLCLSLDVAGVAGWNSIFVHGWGLTSLLECLPGKEGVSMAVQSCCFCTGFTMIPRAVAMYLGKKNRISSKKEQMNN